MLKMLKDWYPRAALAMVAALVLSGPALASDPLVPASEAGPFTPEQLRSLLSGKVQVTERVSGPKYWRGSLRVRLFSEDGRWTGCVLDRKGKVYHQKIREWSVSADSRGRGKLFSIRPQRKSGPKRSGPFIIHYDPDTGRLLWRSRAAKSDRWVDHNAGWFQAKWPQIAVDKCPALDLGGLAVDERQTGATLEELRRQAPEAALTDLVQPLPGPQTRKCEFREEKRGRGTPCASGTGEITTWHVFAGRCTDWGMGREQVSGGGKLVREEIDDSACEGGGPALHRGIIPAADTPRLTVTQTSQNIDTPGNEP